MTLYFFLYIVGKNYCLRNRGNDVPIPSSTTCHESYITLRIVGLPGIEIEHFLNVLCWILARLVMRIELIGRHNDPNTDDVYKKSIHPRVSHALSMRQHTTLWMTSSQYIEVLKPSRSVLVPHEWYTFFAHSQATLRYEYRCSVTNNFIYQWHKVFLLLDRQCITSF